MGPSAAAKQAISLTLNPMLTSNSREKEREREREREKNIYSIYIMLYWDFPACKSITIHISLLTLNKNMGRRGVINF